MPRKSRHGKRKLPRSKRGQERHGVPAMSTQQPAVAQTHTPAPHPEISAPSVSAPATRTAVVVTRYPYIVAELRRIGILAGVILVILVILALVFS